MGLSISSLFNSFNIGRQEKKILLVGLDAAGKTTILFKLKLGEVVTTTPTIGFNVETVQYKKLSFTMWDIGGQDRIRSLWRHYYEGANAIIFVVDSNDRERIEEVSMELTKMFEYDELRNACLLILSNKQDLPNAMSASEVMEKMDLHNKMKQRPYFVQPCVAPTGEGLYEGLEWLSTALSKQRT
jgi:ADP-ribosylation factor 1/2